MADLRDESSFDWGLVDIHAHILPGIDDGAVAIEESIEMAKAAVARGVSAIIATPHFNSCYKCDRTVLDKEVASLREALNALNVDLKVYPGAEVRISPEVLDSLDAGRVQPLAGSRYVLIELPFDEIPFYARDLVFKLRLKGLVPVLAHPERSASVQKRIDRLEGFIGQGCLVQLNASSLEAGFGQDYATAVKIIERGWAFAIASDAHDLGTRPPGLKAAARVAARLLGKQKALKLVRENPLRIISDGEGSSRSDGLGSGR